MTPGRTSTVSSGTSLLFALSGYFSLGTITPQRRHLRTFGCSSDQTRGSSRSSAPQAGQRQKRRPDWTGTRSATCRGSRRKSARPLGLAQNWVRQAAGISALPRSPSFPAGTEAVRPGRAVAMVTQHMTARVKTTLRQPAAMTGQRLPRRSSPGAPATRGLTPTWVPSHAMACMSLARTWFDNRPVQLPSEHARFGNRAARSKLGLAVATRVRRRGQLGIPAAGFQHEQGNRTDGLALGQPQSISAVASPLELELAMRFARQPIVLQLPARPIAPDRTDLEQRRLVAARVRALGTIAKHPLFDHVSPPDSSRIPDESIGSRTSSRIRKRRRDPGTFSSHDLVSRS